MRLACQTARGPWRGPSEPAVLTPPASPPLPPSSRRFGDAALAAQAYDVAAMALYGPHAAVNFGHATANANAAALDGDAGMRALRKLWLTHHPRWRERETTHGTVQ